jgi:D-glycero-D-manno-heptose 1,7-bisphosphate phosphatase
MDGLDAVFLDRDGTINKKPPKGHYVSSPSQLRLLPGAGHAVRALNATGALVFVVTNQRGVALGKMSLADVYAVNGEMARRLRRFGAQVDGWYICPHAAGTCECRKPGPGLLFQASRDHPCLRLSHSVMIGDSETDVEAAMAGGARPIRLGPAGTHSSASSVYPDLAAAVAKVIRSGPGTGRAV